MGCSSRRAQAPAGLLKVVARFYAAPLFALGLLTFAGHHWFAGLPLVQLLIVIAGMAGVLCLMAMPAERAALQVIAREHDELR